VWVHARDHGSGRRGERTRAALLERARAAADRNGAWTGPIGGGSLAGFAELVRHDLSRLPAVCFGVDPTVHADDEYSLLETPTTVAAMADTLAAHAPAAEVHWGPVGHPGLPDTWWAAHLGAVCTVGPAVMVVDRCDDLVEEFSRHAGLPCWDASAARPLVRSVTVWQHDDHLELVVVDLAGAASSLPLDLVGAVVESWTGAQWVQRTTPADRLDLAADEVVRVRLRRGVGSPHWPE